MKKKFFLIFFCACFLFASTDLYAARDQKLNRYQLQVCGNWGNYSRVFKTRSFYSWGSKLCKLNLDKRDNPELYNAIISNLSIHYGSPPIYKIPTQKLNNFIVMYTTKNVTSEDNNQLKQIEKEKNKIAAEKQKIAEQNKKIKEEKEKLEKAKKDKDNEKLFVIGSGTGFFVNRNGYAVSNDHVVGICKKVVSKIKGKIRNFDIIETDKKNDLGLLKTNFKNQNFLNIKENGAEYGEDVVAFGYPLSDALSSSVKLTRGIVSSLSGPGNNYSEIQIDAAIQPGNSGGPVLNMEGQVVGVASSGLNKLFMLKENEYIPENVNFAVAAPTLLNFLKANSINTSNKSLRIKNTKELAKIGRPSTLQFFCLNTKAAYNKLVEQQKHSDVLLDNVVELK